MQLSQLHIFLPKLRLPSGSLFLYIFEAEGVEAEEAITVLPKATPTCGTEQQKPLVEPLDPTLNNTNLSKKAGVLTDKQKSFAEKKAVELMKAHPNEHFQLVSLIQDCEDYLLSPQREEDWVALGNGLDNPFY